MYFFRSDVVFVKRMTFAFEALYGRAGKAWRMIMLKNPIFRYVVFLSETGVYYIECIM